MTEMLYRLPNGAHVLLSQIIGIEPQDEHKDQSVYMPPRVRVVFSGPYQQRVAITVDFDDFASALDFADKLAETRNDALAAMKGDA